MKDKLKDKEEKFAVSTEYRENLQQTIQVLQEQVEITKQFEDDQDVDAMKAKLGDHVKKHEELDEQSHRLSKLLLDM
ncbi:hypothetical protein KQ939_16220 [Planococcus sp. CP5-4]|uniref:hypothetical protein n=1 Tax=unclassified Planococcus (in: firmicutes) TaxID=2662419 RepID=UPI001C240CB0|nr:MULTISPECIES: hypothetical protein [unclassified Planococcus (in: firmicutes)]MBU9673869.1 hypothetical protein [Planococcus sp. CP5-4_YE]MBV0909739.1 hypothetical protein [Planococcus sp. CP5-4_UN]MBW6065223.1 hypothetical protein [Planococcus sp. CP5-4]